MSLKQKFKKRSFFGKYHCEYLVVVIVVVVVNVFVVRVRRVRLGGPDETRRRPRPLVPLRRLVHLGLGRRVAAAVARDVGGRKVRVYVVVRVEVSPIFLSDLLFFWEYKSTF